MQGSHPNEDILWKRSKAEPAASWEAVLIFQEKRKSSSQFGVGSGALLK